MSTAAEELEHLRRGLPPTQLSRPDLEELLVLPRLRGRYDQAPNADVEAILDHQELTDEDLSSLLGDFTYDEVVVEKVGHHPGCGPLASYAIARSWNRNSHYPQTEVAVLASLEAAGALLPACALLLTRWWWFTDSPSGTHTEENAEGFLYWMRFLHDGGFPRYELAKVLVEEWRRNLPGGTNHDNTFIPEAMEAIATV